MEMRVNTNYLMNMKKRMLQMTDAEMQMDLKLLTCEDGYMCLNKSQIINTFDHLDMQKNVDLSWRFVTSYMRKVSSKDMKMLVVAVSIMYTKEGEAVFEVTQDNKRWNKDDLLGTNMRLLTRVSMNYNANLALLRFEVPDKHRAPSMFLDQETIKAMYSGRFTSDPTFMYNIKNGISLVNDRSVLLSRRNVRRPGVGRLLNEIMIMFVYVSNPDDGDILDNTLMHIYAQSCGYTITVCTVHEVQQRDRAVAQDHKAGQLMRPGCRTEITQRPEPKVVPEQEQAEDHDEEHAHILVHTWGYRREHAPEPHRVRQRLRDLGREQCRDRPPDDEHKRQADPTASTRIETYMRMCMNIYLIMETLFSNLSATDCSSLMHADIPEHADWIKEMIAKGNEVMLIGADVDRLNERNMYPETYDRNNEIPLCIWLAVVPRQLTKDESFTWKYIMNWNGDFEEVHERDDGLVRHDLLGPPGINCFFIGSNEFSVEGHTITMFICRFEHMKVLPTNPSGQRLERAWTPANGMDDRQNDVPLFVYGSYAMRSNRMTGPPWAIHFNSRMISVNNGERELAVRLYTDIPLMQMWAYEEEFEDNNHGNILGNTNVSIHMLTIPITTRYEVPVEPRERRTSRTSSSAVLPLVHRQALVQVSEPGRRDEAVHAAPHGLDVDRQAGVLRQDLRDHEHPQADRLAPAGARVHVCDHVDEALDDDVHEHLDGDVDNRELDQGAALRRYEMAYGTRTSLDFAPGRPRRMDVQHLLLPRLQAEKFERHICFHTCNLPQPKITITLLVELADACAISYTLERMEKDMDVMSNREVFLLTDATARLTMSMLLGLALLALLCLIMCCVILSLPLAIGAKRPASTVQGFPSTHLRSIVRPFKRRVLNGVTTTIRSLSMLVYLVELTGGIESHPRHLVQALYRAREPHTYTIPSALCMKTPLHMINDRVVHRPGRAHVLVVDLIGDDADGADDVHGPVQHPPQLHVREPVPELDLGRVAARLLDNVPPRDQGHLHALEFVLGLDLVHVHDVVGLMIVSSNLYSCEIAISMPGEIRYTSMGTFTVFSRFKWILTFAFMLIGVPTHQLQPTSLIVVMVVARNMPVRMSSYINSDMTAFSLASTSRSGLMSTDVISSGLMFVDGNKFILTLVLMVAMELASLILPMIALMYSSCLLHLYMIGSGGSSRPKRTCSNLAPSRVLLSRQVSQIFRFVFASIIRIGGQTYNVERALSYVYNELHTAFEFVPRPSEPTPEAMEESRATETPQTRQPWQSIPIGKVPTTSDFNLIFGGKRFFILEGPSQDPRSRASPSTCDPIQDSVSSYRSPTVELITLSQTTTPYQANCH
ncbi:hypothetical protein CFD26_100997 [Aspergillus turcosus]|uniref:Uncharacterized protein n=1 Tax=Aspergillus turcosus TaxID=1245748 RepID=A0A3R7HPP7_9EURO|nr:hypothetical protein CFD26_100997 [Aspergillus turcosus]